MIYSTNTIKLGLIIWKTKIMTQKIDELALKNFEIVMASFLLQDKLKKV